MWRLWRKLFGWHYVALIGASHHYIRRVHRTQSGKFYVVFYGETIVFLLAEGRTDSHYKWKPL